RVHQRHVRIAGGGVDDKARWFHHHNQLRILVDDIEWYLLSFWPRVGVRLQCDGNGVARLHAMGCIGERAGRCVTNFHTPFLDELLYARAGGGGFVSLLLLELAGKCIGKVLVEARAAFTVADGKDVTLFILEQGAGRNHERDYITGRGPVAGRGWTD